MIITSPAVVLCVELPDFSIGSYFKTLTLKIAHYT